MAWKILVRMRRQYAVYWAPTGEVGDDGEPVFAKPVELKVRWEGIKVLRRDGPVRKENETREVVYVGQEVKRGGVLWKGRLSKCPAEKKVAPYKPFAGDELAYEITKYSEYPTIKATKFLRVAVL